MRRLLGALAVAFLTGCTPAEVAVWQSWHDTDPAAADAFASELATQPAPTRSGCDGIYDEFTSQGASTGVAQRFAYVIAPRESHCSPQFVHNSTDWSYSRLGLNGLTAGLRATWASWCGADVRSDTRVLSTDVRCALAAYDRMGWAPWR
jgi:hypothetical protein